MSDELERLAKKGRASQASDDAEARESQRKKDAAFRKQVAEGKRSTSLVGAAAFPSESTNIGVLVFLVLLIVPALTSFELPFDPVSSLIDSLIGERLDAWGVPAWAVSALVYGILVWLAVYLLARVFVGMSATATRVWLKSLPFEIDATEYFHMLGDDGSGLRPTIVVHFERSPGETIDLDELKTVFRGAELELYEDGELELGDSDPKVVAQPGEAVAADRWYHSVYRFLLMPSRRTGVIYGPRKRVTNHEAHSWFEDIVDELLMPLNRRHDIARVEVS